MHEWNTNIKQKCIRGPKNTRACGLDNEKMLKGWVRGCSPFLATNARILSRSALHFLYSCIRGPKNTRTCGLDNEEDGEELGSQTLTFLATNARMKANFLVRRRSRF